MIYELLTLEQWLSALADRGARPRWAGKFRRASATLLPRPQPSRGRNGLPQAVAHTRFFNVLERASERLILMTLVNIHQPITGE